MTGHLKRGDKNNLAEDQHSHEMTLTVYHSHKHNFQADNKMT